MFFGYVRVSTGDQAEGTSLEHQRRVCQGIALANGFGGFDLQIYEDIGISGGMPLRMRPAGFEMWTKAQKGDIVAAAKFDRMFRDVLDAHRTYKEFKERGIDLILYDLGSEPVTRDAGLSKVFFGMLSVFAEFERDRIRDRVLRGKEMKRQQGGHTGGLAPIGWRIEGEGRESRLVKDDKEQEMLREIVGMRLYSIARICRTLAQNGYLTRNGKPYERQQIHRIFNRLKADGLIDWTPMDRQESGARPYN